MREAGDAKDEVVHSKDKCEKLEEDRRAVHCPIHGVRRVPDVKSKAH